MPPPKWLNARSEAGPAPEEMLKKLRLVADGIAEQQANDKKCLAATVTDLTSARSRLERLQSDIAVFNRQ